MSWDVIMVTIWGCNTLHVPSLTHWSKTIGKYVINHCQFVKYILTQDFLVSLMACQMHTLWCIYFDVLEESWVICLGHSQRTNIIMFTFHLHFWVEYIHNKMFWCHFSEAYVPISTSSYEEWQFYAFLGII